MIPALPALLALALVVPPGAPARAQDGVIQAPDAKPAEAKSDAPLSLMFLPAERDDLLKALAKRPAKGDISRLSVGTVLLSPKEVEPPSLRRNLYLSAILYGAAQDWAVWINGVKMRPGDKAEDFDITAVTPDHVDFEVPMGRDGRKPFRLFPYQTLIAEKGTVVEGRAR
ncbi:MAG: hypothetical protein HQL38_09490 [Alphaproteobacteria bacterium]|nr:hypothetical protein [Alphaproteobacteria bacterium]